MKSNFTKLFSLALVSITVYSCQKDPAPIAVTGIQLSNQRLLLNVGSTNTLSAEVKPLEATNQTFNWSSGNIAIVTVNTSGLVTGIKPGTAIITATTADGNKTDTCTVTVIKWTSFNTMLPDRLVSSIAIDAQGNKWVGTWNGGVSKFDNTNWTFYNTSNSNLSNNMVISMAIDSQDNKWFGTINGISKFDGSNWKFYQTNGMVWAIGITGNGTQWWGTSYWLLRFGGLNWTSNSPDVTINTQSIAIDSQGNGWFGSYANGVSKYDGANWTTYTTANSGLAGNPVKAIAVDAQGNKWFGTWGYGVSKFDGTTWTNYRRTNGLAGDTVVSIVFDSQGNKWFGTWQGVSEFDGTNWTTFRRKNGLVCDTVTSIAIDAQGKKWFGTWNGVSELQDF